MSTYPPLIMSTICNMLPPAVENGARRALVPLENKRNFLDVSGDVVERVDPHLLFRPHDGGHEGASVDVSRIALQDTSSWKHEESESERPDMS